MRENRVNSFGAILVVMFAALSASGAQAPTRSITITRERLDQMLWDRDCNAGCVYDQDNNYIGGYWHAKNKMCRCFEDREPKELLTKKLHLTPGLRRDTTESPGSTRDDSSEGY